MDLTIESVKNLLHSVLVSEKGGVPLQRLNYDYRDLIGTDIPFKMFGFRTLKDFLQIIPDVCEISSSKGEWVCMAIGSDKTAHIERLVAQQKNTKKRRARPLRRKPQTGRARPQSHAVSKPFTSRPIGTSKTQVNKNQPKFLPNLPPRLQKLKELENQSQPTRLVFQKAKEAILPAKPVKAEAKTKPLKNTVLENKKKLQDLAVSCSLIPVVFNTLPAGKSGFVSTVKLKNNQYGSHAVLATREEAEEEAAKNALEALHTSGIVLNNEAPVNLDDKTFIKRLLQIMEDAPKGLWGSRVPKEHFKKYKQKLPPDWLNIVEKHPDVIKVERLSQSQHVVLSLQELPTSEISTARPTLPTIPVAVPDSGSLHLRSRSPVSHQQPPPSPVTTFPVSEKMVIPSAKIPRKSEVVIISHVNTCDNFYVQSLDGDIDVIMASLKNALDNVRCKPVQNPTAGNYCAALYKLNHTWCRAQILSAEKGTVEVKFIDFGNVEILPSSLIMELPSHLYVVPVQAVHCALLGVAPTNGISDNWDVESNRRLLELTDGKHMLMTVIDIIDEKCFVNLLLSESHKSVADELIEQGYALRWLPPSISPKKEPKLDLDAVFTPAQLELPDAPFWDVYVLFVTSATEFAARLIGDDYSIKYERLEEDMSNFYSLNSDLRPVSQPKLKHVYAVQVEEGVWFRGEVHYFDKENLKVDVLFLDIGYLEKNVPVKYLRFLVSQFQSLPYQAINCTLDGIDETDDYLVGMRTLVKLVQQKSMVAEIVDRYTSDDSIHVVLYDTSGDEDLNINQFLNDALVEAKSNPPTCDQFESVDAETQQPFSIDYKLQAKSNPPTSDQFERDDAETQQPFSVDYKLQFDLPVFKIPTNSQFFDLYIPIVISPDKFIIQPWQDGDNLFNMTEQMNKFYKKPKNLVTLNKIHVGAVYVGTLEEGKICRLKVLELLGDNVAKVYSTDWGDHDLLKCKDLQPLHRKFCGLPATALEAKLYGISPASKGKRCDTYTPEARKFFRELVVEKSVVGRVCREYVNSKNQNSYELILIDTSAPNVDVNINSELILHGHALPIEEK